MTGLPEKLLLSRRDIVGETGITNYMFRKLVACGALKAIRPAGFRHAKFLRRDVERILEGKAR